MKHKRLLVILAAIVAVLVLVSAATDYKSAAHAQRIRPTDSGFDSDWGGGSDWGGSDWGGSDWDSDDDDYDYGGGSYGGGSSGGGSGGGSGGDGIIILILIATIAAAGLMFYLVGALPQQIQRRRKLTARMRSGLPQNMGKSEELNQMAYDTYVKLQNAWMQKDLAPVRHLLTDEMYNMYEMQLDTLRTNKQTNVMTNFKFKRAYTSGIARYNGQETLTMVLEVSCKDYLVDDTSNEIIQGNRKTNWYIYELTFVRDLNAKEMHNCPNCGGKLENQMGGNCPYCGNPVNITTANYTLADKRMLRQTKL